MPDTQCSE